ncbi:MAG: alkaline phosphatase family protein [Desulfobacteraceae bacterium]|jgi:2,3-bisphosphoglycerate-independent phosphoglycerate mutase
MKFILVLLDGLGDRSYASLGFKTPLQAARTPNLDKLAVLGANGLYHASFLGQSLPSESAHYLMFGYSLASFPGRGLLEAVGEGIKFKSQDLLILAHLCNVKHKGGRLILTKGRDRIKGSKNELGNLFQTLGPYEIDRIAIEIHQTRRNDAILILKGPVSPYISDSDPITPGLAIAKIVPLDKNPDPRKTAITARTLNRYLTQCFQLLTHLEHPSGANFLATQRAGMRRPQTPFQKKWGLKGKVITSVSVLGGLAKELGMDYVKVRDTSDPGGDLKQRIRLALDERHCDFVHVHTKVPDEAAHNDDPELKRRQIERLDSGLEELFNIVNKRRDILVAVTADHSTPSQSTMVHSGEPVPVMFIGPTVRRDAVRHFDEISAATGGLGMLKGSEILHMAINCMDRGVLSGLRLGAVDVPFFPPPYEPFMIK